MQEVKITTCLPCFPIFCPFTGKKIVSLDALKPSPQTCFIYCEDEAIFEYLAPELTERYQLLESQYEELDQHEDSNKWPTDSPFDALIREIDEREGDYVCFRVTYEGMACGPVSTTLLIGFVIPSDEEIEARETSDNEGELQ